MNTLYINACVRPNSRTNELAQSVLKRLDGYINEVRLFDENLPLLDLSLLKKRDQFVQKGDFSDAMFGYAKKFAEADRIVIAAPYWDLLFPAVLRTYLEAITVTGITFCYTPEGYPKGLCKAKQLIYVTTAGGPIGERNFGFEYVKELSTTFYGIPDVQCIAAEGLDIAGADVKAILEKAKNQKNIYS